MSASFEIFSKVTDYVERQIRLSDLESWLVPRLLVYLDNPDSDGSRLAVLIELCLAEFHDGIRTQRSVRALLAKYTAGLHIRWIEYPEQESGNLTSTSAAVIEPMALLWPDQSPSWNIGPVAAGV